jgi:DNA-binding NtrC family response regulator
VIDLDFRLIAATNRDLEREVAEGRFREDLYYRLKVVTLRIPPLRERKADLPLLADHLLHEFTEAEGKPRIWLGQEALTALSRYDWPGNVRELRNVLESIAVFHPGGEVEPEHLPSEFRGEGVTDPGGHRVQPANASPKTMAEIERQAILDTLELTGGKRSEAARVLDIGLRTLQRKLKEYREQGYIQ